MRQKEKIGEIARFRFYESKKTLVFSFGPSVLSDDILSLDVVQFAQASRKLASRASVDFPRKPIRARQAVNDFFSKAGYHRLGKSGMVEIHPTAPFPDRAGKVSSGATPAIAVF
jgi:hypothetical protein